MKAFIIIESNENLSTWPGDIPIKKLGLSKLLELYKIKSIS